MAHKCHRHRTDNAGIAHLLLGYYNKDVNKETIWLYAYYYQRESHLFLVFFPCSSDPTRDVMMAASVIKKYLDAYHDAKIFEWKLQWKQVSTFSSKSGFHVFKEFLYHAQVMQKTEKGKEDEEDCLSLICSAAPGEKIVRSFHGGF